MTPRALPAACLVLLAALALGGCADRREWRSAEAADTIEAYEAYLAQHPQGDYVPPAQRRLAELKEARDWRIATDRDTADAYRAFIDAYPKGRWVAEARIRIQNFLLDPMPPPVEDIRPPTEADEAAAAAVSAGAAAAPATKADDDALFDAPATPSTPAEPTVPRTPSAPPQAAAPAAPAAAARPASPAPVSHRIQLGAFGSRQRAEDEWARARAQHRELQGLVLLLTPVTSAGGKPMWRVQAGVVSESRAREVCGVLLAARQPCVYAPPGR